MQLPRAETHLLIPNPSFVAVVVLGVILTIGIEVLALVDVSRRSDDELRALGGLPRVAWVVVILIAGPVGGLGYLLYARLSLPRRAQPS